MLKGSAYHIARIDIEKILDELEPKTTIEVLEDILKSKGKKDD